MQLIYMSTKSTKIKCQQNDVLRKPQKFVFHENKCFYSIQQPSDQHSAAVRIKTDLLFIKIRLQTACRLMDSSRIRL